MGFPLVAESWACSLVAVPGLLRAVASLITEHGPGAPGQYLQGTGSDAEDPGL